MKRELVNNATARMPMLLALWRETWLSAEEHLEDFLILFLSFDFAYLVTSSDEVTRTLSEYLRRRGLTLHMNSLSELQPSAAGSRTTVSASCTEDAETTQEGEEKESFEGDLVSMLERNNVGLLLPWLLRDEEPPEVSQQWSRCSTTDSVQVAVRYSFAYNVPVGLFERLSARCHRHSNFIHHWRSGLLLRYGPVTLLFRCDRRPSFTSIITLCGRIQSSSNSRVRLWHVLLRYVADLEDLLKTIPGVLVDGSVHDEASSGSNGSNCGFLKFQPGTTWLPVSRNADVFENLGYSESKHLEAMERGKNCDRNTCAFIYSTFLIV